MKFTKPWALLQPPEEGGIPVPVLAVSLQRNTGGIIREVFVVDSGADVSLAPRSLCGALGLAWERGTPVEIRGISPRAECTIAATIHEVEVIVVEAERQIRLPCCFAEGDAPLLLGREGFFDAFRIQFDKSQSLTSFEW
jgi:hypothetical protein